MNLVVDEEVPLRSRVCDVDGTECGRVAACLRALFHVAEARAMSGEEEYDDVVGVGCFDQIVECVENAVFRGVGIGQDSNVLVGEVECVAQDVRMARASLTHPFSW